MEIVNTINYVISNGAIGGTIVFGIFSVCLLIWAFFTLKFDSEFSLAWILFIVGVFCSLICWNFNETTNYELKEVVIREDIESSELLEYKIIDSKNKLYLVIENDVFEELPQYAQQDAMNKKIK